MMPAHRLSQPAATDRRRGRPRVLRDLWWGGAAAAFVLVATFVVAPTAPQSASAATRSSQSDETQTLVVTGPSAIPEITRDSYTVTPGRDTFIAGGTNHDWARLVLSYGGWPVSDNNVTVITRWMRQENYIDSWWARNNPLNNGWGSGGGSGLGSYPSLVVAAENAAEALHTHPGYRKIVEAFAASAPTEVTEAAIWASPWASSHYANGSHWHYTPVPVVKAPPDAW
jgi:hypothetical protein